MSTVISNYEPVCERCAVARGDGECSQRSSQQKVGVLLGRCGVWTRWGTFPLKCTTQNLESRGDTLAGETHSRVMMEVKCENVSCSVLSDSFWLRELYPTSLLCPWDSPGKNTGVGSHFLLQGNLPDSGIDPGSPSMQADSLLTAPPGKPYNKSKRCLILQGL